VQYWLLRENSRRDREQLARLDAAVAQLADRPPVRVEHQTVIERTVTGEERPTAGTRPASAGDPTTAAKPPIEQVIDRSLSAHYADDAIDHAWSTHAFNELKEVVEALGVQSNVQSMDCRSSLCRIQSTFADVSTYNRFMDQLAAQPGTDGMISPSYDQAPNGTVVATSYWVREGQMARVTDGVAKGPHDIDPRGK